jgi:hypothetical protein
VRAVINGEEARDEESILVGMGIISLKYYNFFFD